MKAGSGLDTRWMVLFASLAGGVAIIFALSLAAITSPARLEPRLGDLEAGAQKLGRVDRHDRGLAQYPTDAVCSRGTAAQGNELRSSLKALVAAQSLALDNLSVGPDDQTPLSETLSAIRVRIQVSGSYEGAVAMLQSLSQMRPTVFVETFDLTSKTTSVSLSLSGRVFCGE